MKVCRALRLALACLCALLFQGHFLIAFAATVPVGACFYALDPTAGRAFQIAGAQTVYTACGIVVESTASDGFEMEGSETLYLQNHSQVSVLGGAQLNGQTQIWDTISNQQVSAVQTSSPGDPLAGLVAPSSGTIVGSTPTYYDLNTRPANNTLSPGVYCGGLTIGNTNGTSFTMSPGVYIMAGGGLLFNSQASVTGTGVTIYNTSSSGWGCPSSYNYTPVTISGQVNANLSAPTTGSLAGVLMFGNRTGCATAGSCQDQINGGSTAILNGALYFKSDQVKITGSNASGYTMLVADKIYINGTSTFGTTGDPFDGITVSVSPSTASLNAGQTKQFTSSVNSANPAVTWSISPASVGSISSNGLYTAPTSISTQQTVIVTATSQNDSSKTASATVALYPQFTLSVSPVSSTLYANGTQQFAATVTNTSNTAVTWSVSGGGTITSAGLYTAPASVNAQQTVTVSATSQANPSITATASLTLMPPVTVTLSPTTATLYASQTQQLTATVTNTSNPAVNWAISGAGRISNTGLYTAPSSITTQQTVTVTATSQANTAAFASAIFMLEPPVSVSVSPASSTLYAGQTQQLTATVANTSNTAVTWSLSGAGSISASGLYLASSSITTSTTVTVTATSQADSTKSAVATIMLEPPVSVSVTPPTVTLYGGQTEQFTASVANSANNGVTWSLSGAGSINASGLYTPPATITAVQTVTVTATSQASPSAAASTTITLEPPVEVTVTPTSAVLYAGQTQELTAAVINTSNTAVIWTVSGAGTVSAGGVYTAPSSVSTQQIVTVTATSQANTAVSGMATLTLQPPVAVTVSPSAATLYAGQTQQLIANVTNTANSAVTWTLTGAGTLSTNGLYTAPASISSTQTVTVIAISQAASTASASAVLTLEPAIGVSLNPVASTLYASQTQQFGANVTNSSNPAVNWSIVPAGVGSITSGGLYTAPASVMSQQSVSVVASSQASPSASATAIVTLEPPVTVTVTPTTSMLYPGQTSAFSATVLNTTNTTVTWSVTGTGTITASGVYTAPATIAGQQTVTITATSQADPTMSSSATVTLSPPVSVTVTPTTVTLNANQTQQFTATVLNSSNTAVTWTLAGTGTISASGLYASPASVLAPATATITATSQADPSQSSSATVTLSAQTCAPLGYGYERTIVINHANVPNTDQVSFPLLVSGTYPFLATVANGGRLQSAAGSDVLFTSDALGQNPLDFEIDNYNGATGTVAYWLRVPNLSHSVDTTIYMWYGNPGITASRENKTGVWSNGYVAVYHMGDGTDLSAADSTGINGMATNVGVTASSGAIGGGGSFQNSSNPTYLDVSTNPSFKPSANLTVEAWFNANSITAWNKIVGLDYRADGSWTPPFLAYALQNYADSNQFGWQVTSAGSGPALATQNSYSLNTWNHAVGTYDGTKMISYLNGVPSAALALNGPIDYGSSLDLTIGARSPYSIGNSEGWHGLLDEVRISNVTRSSDWIATEYANQSTPATFYQISGENALSISPATATLYPSQTQQFSAVEGVTCPALIWTVSPAAMGTVSATGLYTAPANIPAQQTVTIAVTNQADATQSASATVILLPSVAVAVSPASVTLNVSHAQQFTATVLNSSNTAVTWTLAGAGTISATGVYTAPAAVSQQQTVVITAVSQTDPTKSASAAVTLLPGTCASNGYNFERIVLVDHTKIANTDQANFPLLINSKDSAFATVGNGGHVTNASGYDIVFSTDPNGFTKLDHELESYNPQTGQVNAWVRLPTLSHTADTVIYMFYGNAAVTTSQQNPSGVWDSNFLEVLHLDEGSGTTVFDSTANGNNGSKVSSISPAAISGGEIAGAQSFNGTTDFIALPPSMTGNRTTFSVSFWTNSIDTGSNPNYWNQPQFFGDSTAGNNSGDFGVTTNSGVLGMWSGLNGAGDDFFLTNTVIDDAKWHRIDAVNDASVIKLYLDGQEVGQSLAAGLPMDYSGWYLGAQHYQFGGAAFYHQGDIDEFRVSQSVRTADWIATEYNNQHSPSTFYRLFPENTLAITPTPLALYASQIQQFTVIPLAACDKAVAWSITPTGSGTISSTGVYTAPALVTTQQTVTVSAVGQSNSGSAAITLLPVNAAATLALTPLAPSPYVASTTQSFAARLTDPAGVPLTDVAVTFKITGTNPGSAQVITDRGGIATYIYRGINSGSDTIQAAATPNGQLATSGSISVTWLTSTTPNGQYSLTLSPVGPTPPLGLTGLAGAFTDSTGSVVEPLSIGAEQKILIVPAGATQLQLGVDDDRFGDNYGSGFVVAVNGVPFTITPETMPWVWVPGGLNTNYQYGALDGTNPVVVATNLFAGESVAVAYESGTVSADAGVYPLVNADGYLPEITGAIFGSTGSHFATYYMFDLTRPLGQPIVFTGSLIDGSGNPAVNAPVTFTITGANAQQLSAVTDANGNASITYSGAVSGSDTVQAVASLSGGGTASSSSTTVIWIPPVESAPTSTLELTPGSVSPLPSGGQLLFTVLAQDLAGTPLSGVGVGLSVTGADNIQLQGVTGPTGKAAFTYTNENAGTAKVQSIALIGGVVTYSNPVNVSWTGNGNGSGSGSGSGGGPTGSSIAISIQSATTVTLPNPLQLTATATDSSLPPGTSPTLTWSQLSGPGTATFSAPSQAMTSANFSLPGIYVLQLVASDSINSDSAQVEVSVNYGAGTQGWLGSPANGSAVTGIVPIVVSPGTTLVSGRLIYYSASDPYATNPTVLNANVSGSGQIGQFDTTLLKNGSCYIQLQATDSTGHSQYSFVLVTVSGRYKPGRVTASVTDLVVPATGLAINIQRQYDSLNANELSDFGYGWSLGTRVDLAVDASSNVTFTLGGQRRTFYFTPGILPDSGFTIFYETFANYTAEPGLPGTLTAVQDETNCPLGLVAQDGGFWVCSTGAQYAPLGYTYTDASGTKYSMGADGTLKSVVDIGGNTLSVTPAGISSSTGLVVPFTRDLSGRITQITDPQGNNYLYSYDANGNLATVTYPGTSQPSAYTYASGHLYTGGTDFRSNPLPATAYFGPTDSDVNGLPLNGRVQSVTDSLGETTSYAYNLATNTTTTTYPADASGNVGSSTVTYDSYGMVLSSTDPLSLTTTNTYDTNHNLTSVTDPLGHVNSYTYDSLGNKTSATYPKTATSNNTTSSTTYNQYSEPTSTTDELGNVRTFNYDANYWPQSVTDTVSGAPATLASFLFNANGTLQAGAIGYDIMHTPTAAGQFTYDANGNMASQSDALGRTTTFTYDPLGHKLTKTIPSLTGGATGNSLRAQKGALATRSKAAALRANATSTPSPATTTYTYNALGLLVQIVGPLGQTRGFQFDANGNETAYTDPLGNVTSYDYDALNRLTQTTYPTQPATTSTFSYDFRGNVVDAVDQASHDTHRVYDVSGRVTSITYGFGTPSASTTSYTYYADGRRQTETDALGKVTSYTYDAAGHLTSIAGPNGNASYTYDDSGNRISATDATANTTKFQYDSRKRVTKTTYPDSTFATCVYDGQGHLSSKTDQNGNTVQYVYDPTGQLTSVVQLSHPNPANNTNQYAYDNDGNLNFLSDENGHASTGSFDLIADLTSYGLPDGSLTEAATYDLAGNILSWQHFNGKTTSYTYDSQYRLLTKAPDPSLGEPTVTFTYTPTGRPATMTDGSGTTTYTYDTLDRLTAKATPQGTLNYAYNAAGLLTWTASSNTNGISVNYTYDNLNRLSSVVDNRLPAGQNTTTYTYDAASFVVTATTPNQLQSTFTWDSRHRLTQLSTPISTYNYQLDGVGNPTSATEGTGRTITWNYDGINRLTNETIIQDPAGKNGTVGYALDPVGNRLSSTSTLPGITSSSATYNADDLSSAESYDPNGNVLQTGGKSFTYDSDNRLTSMNGRTVTLLYDGLGTRVGRTVAGVTTRYLVDDLNPTGFPQVVEELVNGAVTRQYSYGFQRISESQLVNQVWTPSFYGYDGLGNVRQLTSMAGAVTDTYEYDAFGNVLAQTGTTPNDFLYRGEQFDSALGLQYLRARYYNPVVGRLLSKDPDDGDTSAPETLHPYLYVGSNPLRWRDPSGREAVGEDVLLDEKIATDEGVEEGVEEVGEEVNCELKTAAQTLEVITLVGLSGGDLSASDLFSIGVDYAQCKASAKRKPKTNRKLAKNLEKAGKPRPPDCAAHHIVPEGGNGLEDAYDALDRAGVDIADAANGLWVGRSLHGALHTNIYREFVNDTLKGLAAADVKAALCTIANKIEDGSIPY
jgi:RHS repeat-associated protein